MRLPTLNQEWIKGLVDLPVSRCPESVIRMYPNFGRPSKQGIPVEREEHQCYRGADHAGPHFIRDRYNNRRIVQIGR